MTASIEIFGMTASLETIKIPNEGALKILSIICNPEKAGFIIKESVKAGFPFERTEVGVNIFK